MMPPDELTSLEASSEDAGKRLDRFLADRFEALSRSYLKKQIDSARVTVNGQPARASYKLDEGDQVQVSLAEEVTPDLLPEAIPLEIVYEDRDLLVVNKPAGLTVHPAPGHSTHTLVNALLARYHLEGGEDKLRPGIVHRLDKDTSGLMLVTRTQAAYQSLVKQFQSHEILKQYQVLVCGQVSPRAGVIDEPIGRDPRQRQRMAVLSPGEGKDARTHYEVNGYYGNYSLLTVRLETGRTHQIRVHFGAVGFPVAGDPVYGVKAAFLSRQFLHAGKLGFRLPDGQWRGI